MIVSDFHMTSIVRVQHLPLKGNKFSFNLRNILNMSFKQMFWKSKRTTVLIVRITVMPRESWAYSISTDTPDSPLCKMQMILGSHSIKYSTRIKMMISQQNTFLRNSKDNKKKSLKIIANKLKFLSQQIRPIKSNKKTISLIILSILTSQGKSQLCNKPIIIKVLILSAKAILNNKIQFT